MENSNFDVYIKNLLYFDPRIVNNMFAPSGLGDEEDGERPCQSTPCCRKFGNNNPPGKSQKCFGPPVF